MWLYFMYGSCYKTISAYGTIIYMHHKRITACLTHDSNILYGVCVFLLYRISGAMSNVCVVNFTACLGAEVLTVC